MMSTKHSISNGKTAKKKVIFIDYENIQQIDLSGIREKDFEIKIFIGQSQNTIPFDVVQSVQQFGEDIEWIKIDGNGNNALDFHIAFYLGSLSQKHRHMSFIVLSKDKGFDPLIRHLNKKQIDCSRINSILELSPRSPLLDLYNEQMSKVLENLSKITKNKRPRKRKTLQQHISALFQKKLGVQEIEKIIDVLFVQKKVYEENNALTYNF